jgi:hypothetical protein
MFLHKLFHQVRLHYQAGAQAVYTWRHKDIFLNANEALASIGICALLNMVMIYISFTQFNLFYLCTYLIFPLASFHLQISYVFLS